MIELNWSIEGEKQIHRRLDIIPNNIGDFKVPLFKIGRELRTSVDANFGSRGALFGAKWEPRKDNKTHPLLEKTGKMRRAFSQDLGPEYVAIFNASDYFAFHQSNKPRTSALPRRVMLKIDEIRKRFIVKEFQRHAREAIRKS